MKRLLILLMILVPSAALADDITGVNDGADGWDTGESVTAADMNEIKQEVDTRRQRRRLSVYRPNRRDWAIAPGDPTIRDVAGLAVERLAGHNSPIHGVNSALRTG